MPQNFLVTDFGHLFIFLNMSLFPNTNDVLSFERFYYFCFGVSMAIGSSSGNTINPNSLSIVTEQ